MQLFGLPRLIPVAFESKVFRTGLWRQGLTTVDDFIIIYFSQDRPDLNQKARVFTCAFDNSGT